MKKYLFLALVLFNSHFSLNAVIIQLPSAPVLEQRFEQVGEISLLVKKMLLVEQLANQNLDTQEIKKIVDESLIRFLKGNFNDESGSLEIVQMKRPLIVRALLNDYSFSQQNEILASLYANDDWWYSMFNGCLMVRNKH